VESKKSELDDLVNTAREELIDKYEEEIRDRIEDGGLSYFTDELGYSAKDAISWYFNFDESGLESYLAENEDRGNSLASYDGNEDQEEYDGVTYYIYQIN